jgi:septal ring factor EnvC (AmiA/AmiB activator)
MATQQRLQATLRELTSGDGPPAAAAAPAAPTVLPLAAMRGELEWPSAGPLRHRFGQTGAAAGSSVNGIEITAGVGTPVRAVHDGTVAFADTFAGYGKLVIVDHGSQAFSLYGHLLDIGVVRGGQVRQGDVVGAAGFALLGVPGLYFELRVDGRPVDPLQWLKKR